MVDVVIRADSKGTTVDYETRKKRKKIQDGGSRENNKQSERKRDMDGSNSAHGPSYRNTAVVRLIFR